MTKDEFIAEIKKMSVLDLAELVKALETEFGISAAPAGGSPPRRWSRWRSRSR